MDIIAIINQLVLPAISALAIWAWREYVGPWIKQNKLEALARTAVYAAEQMYGAEHGGDKFDTAVTWLRGKSKNLSADDAQMLVESAVLAMRSVGAEIKKQ